MSSRRAGVSVCSAHFSVPWYLAYNGPQWTFVEWMWANFSWQTWSAGWISILWFPCWQWEQGLPQFIPDLFFILRLEYRMEPDCLASNPSNAMFQMFDSGQVTSPLHVNTHFSPLPINQSIHMSICIFTHHHPYIQTFIRHPHHSSICSFIQQTLPDHGLCAKFHVLS